MDREYEPISTHKGNGSFLVMDDEEWLREVIGEMLESFGYSVFYKSNGADAVNFFLEGKKANRKIAGMIFDLTIPGSMGGLEALREIRKFCTETPIFLTSGYVDAPTMLSPEEFGFTASINKPFLKMELSEMLNRHIK